MAREAVRLLVEQIRARRSGAEPQVVQKMLKFALVKRDSSAPFKVLPPETRSGKDKA
jgi:DNA-binding LacI/PurR family transcriptional regulator